MKEPCYPLSRRLGGGGLQSQFQHFGEVKNHLPVQGLNLSLKILGFEIKIGRSDKKFRYIYLQGLAVGIGFFVMAPFHLTAI
jgi:hypothetical protein